MIKSRNEAIDLFLQMYLPSEKLKIDKDNKPVCNLKITSKELIKKKQSEELFDILFYKNSEKETGFLGEKTNMESLNSDKSDKLNSNNPELVNYLDLYNITPYKVNLNFLFRFSLHLKMSLKK